MNNSTLEYLKSHLFVTIGRILINSSLFSEPYWCKSHRDLNSLEKILTDWIARSVKYQCCLKEFARFLAKKRSIMNTCQWQDCNKVFYDTADKAKFMQHVESHVGYPKKSTFVPFCKWSSCNVSKSTRGAMVSHLAVHVDVRPFPCNCGKAFKRKYDRIVHQRRCAATAVSSISTPIQIRMFNDPLKEIIAQFEQANGNN